MVEAIERILRFWRWRRATTVVITTSVALGVALATREIASLSVVAIILITSFAGTLTGLLFLVDRVEQGRAQRDESFRRLRQQGERLVIYDRETGLYAYWYFSLRLQEEMARSDRLKEPFSLLLAEVTNGRLGPDFDHKIFDGIAQSFRQTDLVAHLGNLRFVALLPNADEQGTTIVSERLRVSIQPLRVEIGRASYPADGADWPTLLAAAGASSEAVAEAQRDIESIRVERRLPLGSRAAGNVA